MQPIHINNAGETLAWLEIAGMLLTYSIFKADWIHRQRPELGWPRRGIIQFNNYKTRYRPGLELVLKGINCNIRNGERVSMIIWLSLSRYLLPFS